jgi:predicted signal transduction protein with EAL and GGDEF domain
MLEGIGIMSESKQKKSLQVPLAYFLMGTLTTASTLIALEKYKVALIAVLVGGACTLIVSLVIRLVHWLNPEGD